MLNLTDEECKAMTIDETGNQIEETSMNELVAIPRPVLDAENITMIQRALSAISNTLVDASQLAHEFATLKDEVRLLREETARANHFREIADNAYQQVNAQRISAETELTTVRFERDNARTDKDHLQFDVQALNGKLAEANGRIAALEEDQTKLIGEMDKAIGEAEAKADAKVREVEERYTTRIHTLSEMVRERDVTIADLRSKLYVSERDNRTLRQMLSEAKVAFTASMAVLEGQMAAE